MKKILRHAGLLASAAFVLTTGSAALAGEPAGKGGDVKVERKVIVMRGGPGGDHGGPMGMRHDPEARAQHLRILLQLRPDQEPALKTFLEATRPPAYKGEMKRADHGKPPESPAAPRKMLTTPERLDQQAKRMAERQAAFSKRAAATRAFYGQLSPSQQKVFDTLHARHGGRHMKVIRRGGPGGPGGHGERMMMRPGGPEGGPPMPGGMAWNSEDGEDFALLEAGDMDVQVFIDDEDVDSGEED
jgi:hypothetical protein